MGSYPDSFHRKSLRTFSVATEKLYDGFGGKSNFRRDKKAKKWCGLKILKIYKLFG
jgi:hypothetical protein